MRSRPAMTLSMSASSSTCSASSPPPVVRLSSVMARKLLLNRSVNVAQVADVVAVVRFVAGPAVEPGVEDLAQHGLAGRPQRQRQRVRVVPPARSAGGLRVGAEGGPHAGNLVGGYGRPRAGPAAHDRLIRAALGHVAGGGLAGPGPVVAIRLVQGAVQQRFVPPPLELLDHGL